MNWKMISYRLQQLFILILHLILLGWMYYTLSEAGMMKVSQVLFHFLGMGVYGALLIYGSAQWGKRLYRNEKLEK